MDTQLEAECPKELVAEHWRIAELCLGTLSKETGGGAKLNSEADW